MDKKYIIAIDGPSAAGKSVLAKGISKELGITYIDTGAMYRAVALYFLNNNIEINEENISNVIDNININLKYIDGNLKVFLNDEDVTLSIRENRASMGASNVSKFKQVRDKMVALQRDMANDMNVVLDGRDIGTVVFPNADLKIFLTASVDVRAMRRKKELDLKGESYDIEELKKEIIARDLQDTTRKESPLKKADDAIQIDTSDLTVDETVKEVIDLLKERVGNV